MKKIYTIELPKNIELKTSNFFNELNEIELSIKNENSILSIDAGDNKIIAIKAYDENKNDYYRDKLTSKKFEYSKIILDKDYNRIELYLDGYHDNNPIILTSIK